MGPDAIVDDRHWMIRAIELAEASVAEPGKHEAPPKVGAVLVRDGRMQAEGFRGATGPGDHAEFGILERVLKGVDVTGGTIYTTLEPCSRRSPDKVPCAQRIVERGVAEVWIGAYDPDPRITREGWLLLREGGVRRHDFPEDLRDRVGLANAVFIDQFRVGHGDRGSARFDYTVNNGQFLIAETSAGVFKTQWTSMGPAGIYALDDSNKVAMQRYADRFEDIDDPGAVAFVTHTLPVREGEIVVFRNELGYLLVHVDDVLSQPPDDRWEARISWEVRPRI
jgi:diaminohydroxyphosphoribosylaminopyrimidine deaminase/5-amino-6-(5-phosphoribosylamino)uracil reductase